MDDIYFTDKKGRRNGNDNKPSSDRFTESRYEAPEYNSETYNNKKKAFPLGKALNYYSVIYGNNAICLARLIASVSWR